MTKKILFSDKYGLTDAVLKGRKTMTRRGIADKDEIDAMVYARGSVEKKMEYLLGKSKYKIGEVVAVAQSYKDLGYTKEWVEQHISPNPNAKPTDPFEKKYPGWNNKMFVPSELNNAALIRITNIKVERLQDISREDCLREGIYKDENGVTIGYPIGVPFYYTFYGAVNKDKRQLYWTFPREAFSVLIDKVSGKGTWEKNPFVFAYTFKRIK
jgi:hypothetical protein